MWFLLAGRVSWRRLVPYAVAMSAFWLGMLAVFSVIFSGMVISYDQKYGPIRVVFGLMSFFIAVGVVIILGAAVGLMWQDAACPSGPRSGNGVTAATANALGLHLLDYLQFTELSQVCAEIERWSFLCMIAPLRLPTGTGSPVNPIAIL